MNFVVATPQRSPIDPNALALERAGELRLLALGTRRGVAGVSAAHTRLNPLLGLLSYAATRNLSPYWGEHYRSMLHPVFDRWVKMLLKPGDHILSSFGYANECFKWTRKHGGKTFLDAGNSHPENYWALVSEEHRRWGFDLPPYPRNWYERGLRMMEHVDYVMAPSLWVRNSFIERGWEPKRILRNAYPVNLAQFSPDATPRPKNRPFTIINTGSISLRKGSPYLLEAFRIIREHVPDARLLLTDSVSDSMKTILPKFSDVPVEWTPPLPHPELARHLKSADLFILPSIEEGLARTSIEAMACGLPVIVTEHTGSNDYVIPGVNGDVVPICNAERIVETALAWWERIRASKGPVVDSGRFDRQSLSFRRFETEFLSQLRDLGLATGAPPETESTHW